MLSVAILIGVARAIPYVLSQSYLDIYIAGGIASGLGNVSSIG